MIDAISTIAVILSAEHESLLDPDECASCLPFIWRGVKPRPVAPWKWQPGVHYKGPEVEGEAALVLAWRGGDHWVGMGIAYRTMLRLPTPSRQYRSAEPPLEVPPPLRDPWIVAHDLVAFGVATRVVFTDADGVEVAL